MTRSQRLEPLARLAEKRELEAARAVAATLQTLTERRQRHAELESYLTEYHGRLHTQVSRGMASAEVQRYRGFLQQLETAIAHQAAAVSAAQAAHEQAQRQWRELHTRTQSLDKTITRARGEENARKAQREQRENDDRVPRAEGGDAP